MWVVFAPEEHGAFTGEVVIVSDDRDEPEKVVTLAGNALSVEDNAFILHPSSLILSVSPNPLNSSGVVSYNVGSSMPVRIVVSDISGRVVAVLKDGVTQAGYHQLRFDVGDFSSGLYFIQLEAGGVARSAKFVCIK